MQIIKPSVELEFITPDAEKLIEKFGRVCYKSEDKITETSAQNFCKMIKTRNHMSVLEHTSASFRIICDRGVTHELVRHRIMSFSQESTRYCNYSPDKKGMQFIKPAWMNDNVVDNHYMYADPQSKWNETDIWVNAMRHAERSYNDLIAKGWTPQQARSILPNSLKTEIVVTANFREWLHFLELRTSPQAHPDMQVIAKMIGNKLHEVYPIIFEKQYV